MVKPDDEWHTHPDKFIATILKLSAPGSGWSWLNNSRCKYVSVRFDMRDGAFVLLDRDGKRISLKDLENQERNPDV